MYKLCTGYPEFGWHLNRTGRQMIYSCSWPVYQIYSGMQVCLSQYHRYTLQESLISWSGDLVDMILPWVEANLLILSLVMWWEKVLNERKVCINKPVTFLQREPGWFELVQVTMRLGYRTPSVVTICLLLIRFRDRLWLTRDTLYPILWLRGYYIMHIEAANKPLQLLLQY